MLEQEPKDNMQRWRCLCSYDGTDFLGWQSQKEGGSVQDAVEANLLKIFKRPVRIHGSGRTDAGVHARGQVFHFDANWSHSEQQLIQAINTNLGPSLVINELKKASHDFHARYGAIKKRYSYSIHTNQACPMKSRYTWSLFLKQDLNINAMVACAKQLIGTHDFSAFAVNLSAQENPIKELYKLEIERKGQEIMITTEASGYLYKMVRSLVGTLVEVGRGKVDSASILNALKNKQRTHHIVTAPAKGLCMERVSY